jgi:hypothetical protein
LEVDVVGVFAAYGLNQIDEQTFKLLKNSVSITLVVSSVSCAGLIQEPKPELSHIDSLLKHYAVKRIVIGHTLVDTISADYEGKVLCTSSRKNSDSYTEALMLEGDNVWKIDTLEQKIAL